MLATLIGLIFGFATGAILAGLTVMEQPGRWVVSLSLSRTASIASCLTARAGSIGTSAQALIRNASLEDCVLGVDEFPVATSFRL